MSSQKDGRWRRRSLLLGFGASCAFASYAGAVFGLPDRAATPKDEYELVTIRADGRVERRVLPYNFTFIPHEGLGIVTLQFECEPNAECGSITIPFAPNDKYAGQGPKGNVKIDKEDQDAAAE